MKGRLLRMILLDIAGARRIAVGLVRPDATGRAWGYRCSQPERALVFVEVPR